MNKPGFTLVEVLLASAIAAILTGLLFMVVRQLNSSVPVIDRRADIYEKIAIINAQLERDLSGIVAPNEFYARQKIGADQKQTQTPEKKDQDAREDKEGQETAPISDQASKKPLEKIFYSTNRDGMLDQLTFITVNPLQIYWGKSGSTKPRMVHVLYTMQEEKRAEKNAKRSYRLVRQESPILDWDAFKAEAAIKEYTLADNIKSLKVEYSAIATSEDKDEKSAQKQIEKRSNWGTKKEEGEKQLPLAPGLAQFTIELWDQKQQRSITFSFAIAIPAQLEEKRSDASALVKGLRGLMNQVPIPSVPKKEQSIGINWQPSHDNLRPPAFGRQPTWGVK